MPHVLILGMTESGKSTLAKKLAADYMRQGIRVLVLDPLADPGFPGDFHTADPDAFLDAFWASRSCAAFIDEAGDEVGRYNTVMTRTATRGRHWGHNVHYITQRGTQLATTVRDQCGHLYLFTTALNDSKIHADEWNNQELRNASKLRAGEYFHVTRFGQLERGNCFT